VMSRDQGEANSHSPLAATPLLQAEVIPPDIPTATPVPEATHDTRHRAHAGAIVNQWGPEIPTYIPFAESDHLPQRPPVPPPPSQSNGHIVSNSFYEEMGFATVTVHKPTADAELGLRLKDAIGDIGAVGGVSLEWIRPTSIFGATHLKEGMNIISINDIDCTSNLMKAAEIMEFLSSCLGDVTIVAVKVVEGAATTAESATDAAAQQKETEDPEVMPPDREPPKPFMVTIQKPNKRASVGISIANEVLPNKSTDTTDTIIPVIRKVDPKGLCAQSRLRPGMQILSINGLKCYTKEDSKKKIKRATAMVQFQVQDLMQEHDTDVAADHGTSV
jgi:hypothetical protein